MNTRTEFEPAGGFVTALVEPRSCLVAKETRSFHADACGKKIISLYAAKFGFGSVGSLQSSSVRIFR